MSMYNRIFDPTFQNELDNMMAIVNEQVGELDPETYDFFERFYNEGESDKSFSFTVGQFIKYLYETGNLDENVSKMFFYPADVIGVLDTKRNNYFHLDWILQKMSDPAIDVGLMRDQIIRLKLTKTTKFTFHQEANYAL